MMTQQSLQQPVTRELVPEDRRLAVADRLFGMRFPLELEPVVYGITERMAGSYKGGYWDFYQLSNGGFYMAPAGDRTYHIACENKYEGKLSGDGLGITSCLFAFSRLSFSGGAFAHAYADHYHRLREYMFEHAEVKEIIQATD